MAPSPNDPVTDALASPPADHQEPDPLAELRRAVAAPGEPWPARLRQAVELAAGRGDRWTGPVGRRRAGGGRGRRRDHRVRGVAGRRRPAPGRIRLGMRRPRCRVPSRPRPPSALPLRADTITGTGPLGDLIVQAAGAVVRPGVYHLAAGARVGDLIAQAGGFTADADADRVNLASPLGDGVRVWVPRRGEADPPVVIGGWRVDRRSCRRGHGPPALVDLNTATAAELDALPGVGPATAAAIIDHRHRNGPFRTVDDLAEVRGHRRRQAGPAPRPGAGVTASPRSAGLSDRAMVGLAASHRGRRVGGRSHCRSGRRLCWRWWRWPGAVRGCSSRRWRSSPRRCPHRHGWASDRHRRGRGPAEPP